MPVFLPFLPPGQQQRIGPPDWIMLEPGEVFVRSYGADDCAGGQHVRVAVFATALLIGMIATMQIVAFNIEAFIIPMSKRSATSTDSPDMIPVIVVALIVVALIAVAVAMAKFSRNRRQLQAVLTNRMLVFKVGKDITGFKLEQIVKLAPTDSKRNAGIQIYIKQQAEPVITLPVENIESAMAELNAYSIAAGAKL